MAALASGGESEKFLFDPTERAMIRSVLYLAAHPIPALMTTRLDVVWLDLDATPEELRETLQQHPSGLSLHPFALTLRQAQRSKGIHRLKTGFDRLTPNGF